MKILWSDTLNDYLYGKVMKQVQIKQYRDDGLEMFTSSLNHQPIMNHQNHQENAMTMLNGMIT